MVQLLVEGCALPRRSAAILPPPLPPGADFAGRSRMSARLAGRGPLLLLLLVFAMLAVGCGRKATEEDCKTLIDKNVEIQMKSMNITDSDAIDKKKKEMRTEFEA